MSRYPLVIGHGPARRSDICREARATACRPTLDALLPARSGGRNIEPGSIPGA